MAHYHGDIPTSTKEFDREKNTTASRCHSTRYVRNGTSRYGRRQPAMPSRKGLQREVTGINAIVGYRQKV